MALGRVIFVSIAVTMTAAGSAVAQPATPTPATEPCSVPRRQTAEIVAIVGTPAPAPPAATRRTEPAPEPVGTPRLLRPELPAGEPVDAATVAAIRETMRQYIACVNASDVLAMMALVSDDFLRQTFISATLSEADLEAYAAATQIVPPEQQRRLVELRQARRLSDGRVVALVDTMPATTADPRAITTDLVTFTEVDGRYLINRYVAGVTIWFGPNATPSP